MSKEMEYEALRIAREILRDVSSKKVRKYMDQDWFSERDVDHLVTLIYLAGSRIS